MLFATKLLFNDWYIQKKPYLEVWRDQNCSTPPTAHTITFISLLWVVVYTLGEYKFFHPGDFWNSIKNLSKSQIFLIFEGLKNIKILA